MDDFDSLQEYLCADNIIRFLDVCRGRSVLWGDKGLGLAEADLFRPDELASYSPGGFSRVLHTVGVLLDRPSLQSAIAASHLEFVEAIKKDKFSFDARRAHAIGELLRGERRYVEELRALDTVRATSKQTNNATKTQTHTAPGVPYTAAGQQGAVDRGSRGVRPAQLDLAAAHRAARPARPAPQVGQHRPAHRGDVWRVRRLRGLRAERERRSARGPLSARPQGRDLGLSPISCRV